VARLKSAPGAPWVATSARAVAGLLRQRDIGLGALGFRQAHGGGSLWRRGAQFRARGSPTIEPASAEGAGR
jgi:hypothetical protein